MADCRIEGIVLGDSKIESGFLVLPMSISKGKLTREFEFELRLDMSGVSILELFPWIGNSLRIKVANHLRERGDFAVVSFQEKLERPYREIAGRQVIEHRKLETAEDAMSAISGMSKEQLAMLMEMMSAKLSA